MTRDAYIAACVDAAVVTPSVVRSGWAAETARRDAHILKCLESGKNRVDGDGVIWNMKPRNVTPARPPQRLRTRSSRSGYLMCAMRFPGGSNESVFVHRVVAIAHLGPPPTSITEVNHKNGIKSDNHPDNLEWMTSSDNKQHALRTSLRNPDNVTGELNPMAKLSASAVRTIHRLAAKGVIQREIVLMTGVRQQHVSRILSGHRWPHIYREFHP